MEHIKEDITKPFIKWVGGKTQIINNVMELFPKEINDYYEPFLGGGSVLLALLSYKKKNKIKINGKIYASDINENLITLYNNIKNNPKEVVSEIKKIVIEFNNCKKNEVNRKPKSLEEAQTSKESYYFWIRNKFNNLTDEEKKKPYASSLFIFLNKTCFRGIYREGPRGFNVPYGNYSNPSIYDEDEINIISNLIQEVNFIICSFEDIIVKSKKGDFIYFDPPYVPLNSKSFVSYVATGFKKHDLLFECCKELTNKKISFLMSNSDSKIVNDFFDNKKKYEKKNILCRRAINSKKPDSKINEVLIKNLVST
jgi:DNA adenine methylase